MIQGSFYEIEWCLGQFNAKELELPDTVFYSKNIVTNKSILNSLKKSNIFLYEEELYPENGLITTVLQEKYKSFVKKVSILE